MYVCVCVSIHTHLCMCNFLSVSNFDILLFQYVVSHSRSRNCYPAMTTQSDTFQIICHYQQCQFCIWQKYCRTMYWKRQLPFTAGNQTPGLFFAFAPSGTALFRVRKCLCSFNDKLPLIPLCDFTWFTVLSILHSAFIFFLFRSLSLISYLKWN